MTAVESNGSAPPAIRESVAEKKQRILRSLDLVAEFKAMGVKLVGDTPNASGWIPCHAIDRKDDKPSAAVCVSASNGQLGRYVDSGGEGKSLSFFDLAIEVGRFPDFRSAMAHYEQRAGEQPAGSRNTNPESKPRKLATDQVRWIERSEADRFSHQAMGRNKTTMHAQSCTSSGSGTV